MVVACETAKAADEGGDDADGGDSGEIETNATPISSSHGTGGGGGSGDAGSSVGGGGSNKISGKSVRSNRRWAFDESGQVIIHHDVKVPSGFIAGHFDNRPDAKRSSSEDRAQDDLVYKSAMSIATAPGKQLFMTAFMLYMSGNTLQIFSIMMLGMALWQPIQKLMTVSSAFAKYAESHVDLTIPKIIYALCNLAGTTHVTARPTALI